MKWLFFVCMIYFMSNECLSIDNSKIICTKKFCETYNIVTGCPSMSVECQIQNSTHNGLFLPFGGPCNCCKFCLTNLGLGDDCVSGTPDGPIPDTICGSGLYCDKSTSKCVANPTKCYKEQQAYDERRRKGTLGHLELRPECDRRGNFVPVKCIPGETCFCVDNNGKRIFGEMPYSIQASDLTKCECSRKNNDIQTVLNNDGNVNLARCLPNGNYDRLQCVGKSCICVHDFDGSPSEPDKAPVLVNVVSDMSCFDKELHEPGTYLRSCEKEYNETLKMMQSYKEKGFDYVGGFRFPVCQLDGRYAPVQHSKTQKFCIHPQTGKQLENFVVDKNDPLAKTMNCHCARARMIIVGFEKPTCCVNGNYKTMQCRRGKCRCVDTNGIQVEKEVDYDQRDVLTCNQNKIECT